METEQWEQSLQFELKLYSSKYEWTFPPSESFHGVVRTLKTRFPKLSFRYTDEGLKVLSDGEFIGNLKPCYPSPNKVDRLHDLFQNWRNQQ